MLFIDKVYLLVRLFIFDLYYCYEIKKNLCMVLEFNNMKWYNNINCGILRLFLFFFEGNIVDSEINNKLLRK